MCTQESQHRHYLCHHTSSSDRASSTDRHARQDDHISAKPAILADVDLLSEFGARRPIPDSRIKGMRPGVEAAVGAHQRPRPDTNRAGVDEGGIEIELGALPKDDVEAIVGSNWSGYPGVFVEELVVLLHGRRLRRQRASVQGDSGRGHVRKTSNREQHEAAIGSGMRIVHLLSPERYHSPTRHVTSGIEIITSLFAPVSGGDEFWDESMV